MTPDDYDLTRRICLLIEITGQQLGPERSEETLTAKLRERLTEGLPRDMQRLLSRVLAKRQRPTPDAKGGASRETK